MQNPFVFCEETDVDCRFCCMFMVFLKRCGAPETGKIIRASYLPSLCFSNTDRNFHSGVALCDRLA